MKSQGGTTCAHDHAVIPLSSASWIYLVPVSPAGCEHTGSRVVFVASWGSFLSPSIFYIVRACPELVFTKDSQNGCVNTQMRQRTGFWKFYPMFFLNTRFVGYQNGGFPHSHLLFIWSLFIYLQKKKKKDRKPS